MSFLHSVANSDDDLLLVDRGRHSLQRPQCRHLSIMRHRHRHPHLHRHDQHGKDLQIQLFQGDLPADDRDAETVDGGLPSRRLGLEKTLIERLFNSSMFSPMDCYPPNQRFAAFESY